MNHLTHDQLNDFIDKRLVGRKASDAEQHLAECDECGQRLATLQALLESAASMPRTVEPDQDLWSGIRAQIDQRKVVPLRKGAPAWFGPVRLTAVRAVAAAAGIALFSVTSTIVVMNRIGTGTDEPASVQRTPPEVGRTPPEVGRTQPAAAGVVAGYEATANELMRTLAERRATLPPDVVAQLERNLRVINAALAETKEMLVQDGENETLRALLVAGYQHKVAVLELVVNES